MRALLSGRVIYLSLFLIFTLSARTVLAQGSRNNWNEVQKIKIGSKLTVKTKAGRKHNGKASAITAESIKLSLRKPSGTEIELKRDEIAEIRRKSCAQTAGYAALLGGLGFVGGYGIGYGVGEATEARFAVEYPFAIFGLAAGAVAGAIIGSRGQVIYKTP
jgi:hypothetical protein